MFTCENPHSTGRSLHRCGGCVPCRIIHRSIWAHRIKLEGMCHEDNTFGTLTYRDDDLPIISGPGVDRGPTLEPYHTRDFLKRLRTSCDRGALGKPFKFRFFLVGEYGDETQRPHYHVALFGYPNCLYGQSQYGLGKVVAGGEIKIQCCPPCDLVRKTWGKGNIDLRDLAGGRARYVARYVTKKMTRNDDPRLMGRHPEFARMSLKNGGLGLGALDQVVKTYNKFDLAVTPHALKYGNHTELLGRYLTNKLRAMLGNEHEKQEWILEQSRQLLPLYAFARRSEGLLSAKQVYRELVRGKVYEIKERQKFKPERSQL